MKHWTRPARIINALLILLLLGAASARAQDLEPQTQPETQGTQLGTGFTYQGQLKKKGELYNGTCDFQFSLYDTPSEGNQIGALLTQAGINVVKGVFATKLDFGANVFSGEARWLQVAVKCPGDEGFVIFNTRQELTPAPYALGLRLPLDQTTNTGNVAFSIRNADGPGILGIGTTWIGVEGRSTNGAGVWGDSDKGDGVVGITHANNKSAVYGRNEAGGNGILGSSDSGAGVVGVSKNWAGLWGVSENGDGVVGVAKVDNKSGVYGSSEARGAGVFGISVRGNGVVGIAKVGDQSGVYGYNEVNGSGVSGRSKNGAGIYGWSETGYAGYFDGKVRVSSLEIAGGADLAEPFDVRGDAFGLQPEPGMVVCIDPSNPGALVVCASEHDQAVAGVISGAGGVQPGMIMSQDGTAADGQHPVALTGRVYVWVDATSHPVRPGDQLTTSATPGHAVKVTDHDAARGAIIGKAMTALPEGKGLVLVLVSLN